MITEYLSIDWPNGKSVLSEDQQWALKRLGRDVRAGRGEKTGAAAMLADLGCLPLAAVAQADREIRDRAGLWFGSPYEDGSLPFGSFVGNWFRASAVRLMQQDDGFAFLMVCHGNGHVREAALRAIQRPAPSAFLLALTAYRLNDWVPQVRAASADCMRRLLTVSDADIVADALIYLVVAQRDWRRDQENRSLLVEAVRRDEVRDAIVTRLMNRLDGRPHLSLMMLLSEDRLDATLPRLASDARHPTVRAVAARVLLSGFARWPAGREKVWKDKSMGKSHWTTHYAGRPAAVASPKGMLALIAHDKAAAVRKIAMQAVIDAPDLWATQQALIDRLSRDGCAAIREGMAYILRRQAEESR